MVGSVDGVPLNLWSLLRKCRRMFFGTHIRSFQNDYLRISLHFQTSIKSAWLQGLRNGSIWRSVFGPAVCIAVLLGLLNFLAWLLQCPRPELIPAIVEASKSEIPWLLIILALLVLPFLIYLLVKYCRGKPTILLKNDEGLWEYAPSQKKQIMKGDRRQFKMKGN